MLNPPGFLPENQRATVTFRPRYEDLTQDGRAVIDGVASALGDAGWRGIVDHHPFAPVFFGQGIVPILRRLVFVSGPGPHSALFPWRVDASMALAHEKDARGVTQRLFMLMWATAHAPHGSTYAPPSKDDPLHPVGTIFAEHVMTRLFAPPDQRRVTKVEGWDILEPAPGPHHAPPAEQLLDLPTGATALMASPQVAAQHVFLMAHTDSNHHVNSMVYPRLFEEAAVAQLRNMDAATPATLLAQHTEIIWRKPFFAGDGVEIRLQTWRDGGAWGAHGGFYGAGEDKPRATLRMRFTASSA